MYYYTQRAEVRFLYPVAYSGINVVVIANTLLLYIEKYLKLAISDLLHLLLYLYYIIEKYWDLLSFYYHFHI